MRRLYRLLLALLPRSFYRPFEGDDTSFSLDDEMYAVFVEASSDARAAGRIAYFAFCIRETSGLIAQVFTHRTSLSRRGLFLPGGAVCGLILALFVTLFLGPETYTSRATIIEEPPLLRAPFLPDSKRSSTTDAVLPLILSRTNLIYLITSRDLYRSERFRSSMEAVVERMRSNITLSQDSAKGTLRIAFRYRDRKAAQAVAAELSKQLLDAGAKSLTDATTVPVDFLQGELTRAAAEWDRLHAQRMDTENARIHYQSISEQLAKAESLKQAMAIVNPAPQLLDAASLPVLPDILYSHIYLAGAAVGAFAGMILALLQPIRWRGKTIAPDRL